jgi:hypothetical protein
MTTPLLPTLADALTRQGLRLRPRCDADALQLDALYQQWRAEQFAASGLAPAERRRSNARCSSCITSARQNR